MGERRRPVKSAKVPLWLSEISAQKPMLQEHRAQVLRILSKPFTLHENHLKRVELYKIVLEAYFSFVSVMF